MNARGGSIAYLIEPFRGSVGCIRGRKINVLVLLTLQSKVGTLLEVQILHLFLAIFVYIAVFH